MKYRIVKNNDGMFAVQYRYAFWPFWIFDKSYDGGGGVHIAYWDTLKSAELQIERLKKWAEKETWTVIT